MTLGCLIYDLIKFTKSPKIQNKEIRKIQIKSRKSRNRANCLPGLDIPLGLLTCPPSAGFLKIKESALEADSMGRAGPARAMDHPRGLLGLASSSLSPFLRRQKNKGTNNKYI